MSKSICRRTGVLIILILVSKTEDYESFAEVDIQVDNDILRVDFTNQTKRNEYIDKSL